MPCAKLGIFERGGSVRQIKPPVRTSSQNSPMLWMPAIEMAGRAGGGVGFSVTQEGCGWDHG